MNGQAQGYVLWLLSTVVLLVGGIYIGFVLGCDIIVGVTLVLCVPSFVVSVKKLLTLPKSVVASDHVGISLFVTSWVGLVCSSMMLIESGPELLPTSLVVGWVVSIIVSLVLIIRANRPVPEIETRVCTCSACRAIQAIRNHKIGS